MEDKKRKDAQKQAREAAREARRVATRERASSIVNNQSFIDGFQIMDATAEEVLKTYVEMCVAGCNQCPFKGIRIGGNCERFIEENIEEAVHLIAEWKVQQEKKEPEIEWVYRVFGAENFGEKFFETEDEAIKKCEELVKTQKTKKYARYERVCRVKGE